MTTFLRLLTIIWVTARYRLDTLLPRHRLPLPLRILLTLSPLRLIPEPALSHGERIRLALIELGPIFIKFGQMLSTRRDLLDDDITDELELLQDKVPPFEGDVATQIIEEALQDSVGNLFRDFDPQPLASASIAQVHTAVLQDGREVVVKVVRPDIEPTIRSDIALMFWLARLLQRYLPDGKRLRPVEVVEEYQHTIFDELDLQREAANTSQLRRNFQDSEALYIPEVYWSYCRSNVMVMERIYGIPVSDVAAMAAQQTNMKVLAEHGVEIFFTQVFRDNFFHADMHPGNIFVSREHPERPMYIGIDCAIMGSLSDFDRHYLARNLLAIFQQNYREVAQLHVECGWVPADTRVQDFEAAIRAACEPIFEKPLGEISFADMVLYLFQTARRFDMEIQPSLVLLQKTLLHIEGLGRQLYPQLDLWHTAKPFLEDWLKQNYSPKALLKESIKRAPSWLEELPKVPDMLINNIKQNKQLVQLQHELQARQQQQQQRESSRRQRVSIAVAALVGAVIIAEPARIQQLLELPTGSWLLLGIALIALWRR
ncbi:2-octaprenylphenol hydroxylase [Sinobacterium caligoides]|uniref:Probable protein kinase UbiB n=1 Tax=Sinobacterium caligoides TaxID=933926 RepID=A0A3N2DDS9_9GAMM|nr:ubiquinone biosynthesis regulatory protein kinase UbiB [Sinobacterium caligoides]ROR97939.1 2-octaprenylphenol hydroxylase [Sinobacterium caligoides]